ncbi:hypothetical protein GCM10009789_12170 [Kribbella sancticallisti]|uniref:Alpha glucuronidase N-terminal domain-containing protein n=1 Tax=Kribbella sancticallisti TaxID=460087 RepID=A0ABN2CM78_9ACTN
MSNDSVENGTVANGAETDSTAPGGLPRRRVLQAGAGLAAGAMALSPGQALATGSAPSIRFARGGRTAYTIYVGAGEDAVVRHAAHELATYLKSITTATFPVVVADRPRSTDHLIVVGRHNLVAQRAGIDYGALSDDGFALRTHGQTVVIAGDSSRGTLYGAYWVLDRLFGVRWFGPDFTKVPRTPDLSISRARLNGDQVPHFRFRTVLAGDANDAAYRQHNMLNGLRDQYWTVPRAAGIDTWSTYWPEEVEYPFQQVVTDPKHWYGGQITLMNPETRSAAVSGLVDIIKERVAAGQDVSTSFYQEDRWWTSPDPASQAFADAHGGSLAAPVVDMINDVVGQVRKQIPNARLSTQGYMWSFTPPNGLRVNENVVMTIAPIHADFGQSLFSETNQEIGDSIRRWGKISEHNVLWTYLCTFRSYTQPFPDWWALGDAIKTLAEIPTMQGYFGQSAWNAIGAEFTQLRIWVISRLLWDPSLDPDALIREFLAGYYGAAAKPIYTYMQLMRDAVEETSTMLGAYTPDDAPYLGLRTLARADELFDEAEAAIRGDATLLRHVHALRLGIDLLLLQRSGYFRLVAERDGIDWSPDTQARTRRFEVELKAAGLTQLEEGGGDPQTLIPVFRGIAAAAGRPATRPDAAEGLPASDWADYQEDVLVLYAPAVTVAEDSSASNGHTVRMPGRSRDWAVQLPLDILPEGRWTLHLSVRVDTGTAAPGASALTLGVHPGPSTGVPVSQVADGKYHHIAFPGTYERTADASTYAYVAPPGNAAVNSVSVDRIYAIKA